MNSNARQYRDPQHVLAASSSCYTVSAAPVEETCSIAGDTLDRVVGLQRLGNAVILPKYHMIRQGETGRYAAYPPSARFITRRLPRMISLACLDRIPDDRQNPG
jgi:hypothetical protein